MKNLLIIGVGGVGSYLARALHEYDINDQLFNLQITLADGDEVDVKNLTYQNFKADDILENKAKVLAKKYNFIYIDKNIEIETMSDQLKNYDAIVCAVDGTYFRKQFYNLMFKSLPETYWLDLRSTGKTVAAYSKNTKLTYDDMISTVPKEDVENGSCQHSFELEHNIVQGGNRIISEIGAQLILTWHRGEYKTNPSKFVYNF